MYAKNFTFESYIVYFWRLFFSFSSVGEQISNKTVSLIQEASEHGWKTIFKREFKI